MKRQSKSGPEKVTVNHVKDRNTVFIAFYDVNVSGTLELTPEQAIAIGQVGKMAKTYREEMEGLASADESERGSHSPEQCP